MNFIYLFLCMFLFSSCTTISSKNQTPQEILNVDSKIKQVIIVNSNSKTITQANLSSWENIDGNWQKKFSDMQAVVGRKGLALEGEKHEGDGKTPSGIFKLYRAFGYDATVLTKLDYYQVSFDDVWIDDIYSEFYNQWMRGLPEVRSYERLKRKDDLYKYVVVIEYNTEPIVPGAGSAIFLHVWKDPNHPTAGCVAITENNIKKLLEWLDRNNNPVIILK